MGADEVDSCSGTHEVCNVKLPWHPCKLCRPITYHGLHEQGDTAHDNNIL